MTCIAFDGRYLATDSALFRGDAMITHVDKLHMSRSKDKEFVFALCGDKLHVNYLARYLKYNEHFDFNSMDANYSASCTCGLLVEISKHKENMAQFIYADGSIDPQRFMSIADGSGSLFLMGCLAAGTSAMKAIHLAEIHTTTAGGDVKFIDCLKARKDNDFRIETYIPQN